MPSDQNIEGYPDYVLRGKPGKRTIVHLSSGMIYGKESHGIWTNTDDDGSPMTAHTPEEMLNMNAAASKSSQANQ